MTHIDSQFLLHQQFEEQTRKTPTAIAIREGCTTITFADLDSRANRIAGALVVRGIGDKSMIGLHLERSIDWVAASLAILKVNGAVVPLPPSYPAGRINDILSYAPLDAVIDDSDTPLRMSSNINQFDLAELASESKVPDISRPCSPGQPAFVLCSSGSTGRPKLIVRSHLSFSHRLSWTWEQHPYGDGEVCCQKAPATTTHCVYEVFEPLLRGISVVIICDEDVRDLETFWHTVGEHHVSRLIIVPSALRASLAMPDFVAPALNVLVLMGEYVDPTLALATLAAFPSETHIYSIYGSTEASSTLVSNLRESGTPGEEPLLGTALTRGVRAMVLDSDRQPVAPGGIGRLYMSGVALFDKYLGDSELTSTVLIHVPGQPELLCDTRDEVKVLQDGSLQFVGRVDDTVKVRGFRVDTKEVESALLLDSGVHHAAVVARKDDTGSATLFAFVTPSTIDRSNIYENLGSRVPSYMFPSIIVGLDELPYTANGKLDRVNLLQEYVDQGPAPANIHRSSATERAVYEAWAETLGHRGFTVDNHFFEVGGTSLNVFSLVNHLRQSFTLQHEDLTAQSIYRFPSVAALTDLIDNIRNNVPQSEETSKGLLVTLRNGSDQMLSPFFVIHSAGGTLGAYQKLAGALTTDREIIGIRDPFIWGERDPTEDFQSWVGRYIDAIRERQPRGPYYLGAFSSAGAFGIEIARRLIQESEDVALLALIDPLALDRGSRWRFGWWSMKAVYERAPALALVKLAGRLRLPVVRAISAIYRREAPNRMALTKAEYLQFSESAKHRMQHLINLSALFELNTGLLFALTELDFEAKAPDEFLAVLQARFAELMPEVDPENIERIVVQYDLQIKVHSEYALQPYSGRVLLVEPASRHAGLISAQLRAHVKNLDTRIIELGEPEEHAATFIESFGRLQAHYRSMRDDVFVQELARLLNPLLS